MIFNIINWRMFLGDALSIETHLNNDWTLLLRNLKIRQDHHFNLLQYNHKIVNQPREQNAQLFINDQILQHRQQLSKVTGSVGAIDEEQKEILDKYGGASIQQECIVKLMGRVGARILEIWQSSFDKCKDYDESGAKKHIQMKKMLIQLLNQRQATSLDQIVKCVTGYSKEKIISEADKLKRLIAALQNGDYLKLKEAYSPRERKAVKSLERRLDVLRDLSKVKASKQTTKIQQKQQEKIKKQKQKMMNTLYSTMELSKQQFLEEQTQPPSFKTQRLYNEILGRNRNNSDQIKEFESKKYHFEEKVRIFKEYILNQSRKITQVFIHKPVPKLKKQPVEAPSNQKRSIQLNQAVRAHDSQRETENIMTEGNIDLTLRNQRKLANTQQFKLKSFSTKKQISDLPDLFNSFLGTNQNFSLFRFEASNRQLYSRTNRNMLPDISKGTSLDHKTQITKIKIDNILRSTIKADEKMQQEDHRKRLNLKKIISVNRQEVKIGQEGRKGRDCRNIKLCIEGTTKRGGQKQKHRNQSMNWDNSLHVTKAELKLLEHKTNLLELKTNLQV